MEFFLGGDALKVLFFRLERGLDHGSNSFVAQTFQCDLNMLGKPFEAKNEGKTVFFGKIEAVDFELSSKDQNFQIAGRDLGDFLDSDYVKGPFQWLGSQDFSKIAAHLAKPFSVKILSEKKLTIKNFRVKKGDSISGILRQGAMETGTIFFATENGELKFTSINPKSSGISLAESDLLNLRVCEDHTKTFASYETKSQVFKESSDSQRTTFLSPKTPPEWFAERKISQEKNLTIVLPKLLQIPLGETLKLTTRIIRGEFLIAGITWQLTPSEGPTTTLKLQEFPIETS